MIIKCSQKTIRKFILCKQLLFPPREATGMEGIELIFNTLRAIQYDPQNPCGRSVDLSLQARVRGISPSDYHYWLYQQRKGIEVYDKELTVVPIEDLPLCRGKFPLSRERKLTDFLDSNEEKLKQLIKHIEKHGPVCSSDFSETRQVDIFWEPTRWSKAALDSLWKVGKLVISYRKNGRKYYDLPHKVYGNKFVWKNQIFKKKLHDDYITRRIKSIGMLPASGTGTAWLGIGIGKEIKPVVLKLVKQKKLIEIEVDGAKNRYVINSSDLDLLLSLKKKSASKKMSFLPPLDNLLWDRKMVKDIFGFEYKWEAYTPVSSRKFGHYVLPILYGLEFIGKIEPKYNKGILEIKGFWIEPNYRWNNEASKDFWKYLEEFQNYLKSKNAKWFCDAPK